MSKVAKVPSGGSLVKRSSRVPLVVVTGVILLVIDQQKIHLLHDIFGHASPLIVWILVILGITWLIARRVSRRRDKKFIEKTKKT